MIPPLVQGTMAKGRAPDRIPQRGTRRFRKTKPPFPVQTWARGRATGAPAPAAGQTRAARPP